MPSGPLVQTIQSSFTTALVMGAIALIYAVVVRFAWKVPWTEVAARIGLRVGSGRYYGYAAVALVLGVGATLALQFAASNETNSASPYLIFRGQALSPLVMLAIFSYGMVNAGFAEELLFRGLIAGAVGRRMSLRNANAVQAVIFLLPHLLILLVAPNLWWVLIPLVLALGLMLGWLRLASGSLWPSVLMHGGGNTLVGVLYLAGVL